MPCVSSQLTLPGSFCTIVTNPIWTVQAYQSTRAVASADGEKKSGPSAVDSFKAIIKADGVKGLWRGIGPALILVINPVIQVGKTSSSGDVQRLR